MFVKYKIFFLLFTLHYKPSKQQLQQQNGLSNNSNSEDQKIIHPNAMRTAETIQQIDVKDVEDKVISTIHQVAINDDNTPRSHSNNLYNDIKTDSITTNNSPTNNTTFGNDVASILNNGPTLNSSTPMLQTGQMNDGTLVDIGATSAKDANIMVSGSQNNLAYNGEETKQNASIQNHSVVSSRINKGINTSHIQNNTSIDNNSYNTLKPNYALSSNNAEITNGINYISTIPINSFNSTNNADNINKINKTLLVNISDTNISDEDTQLKISFRSDFPKKRRQNISDEQKQNKLDPTYPSFDNSLKDFNIADEEISKDNDESRSNPGKIFMLINSGNIDRFSINLPDNNNIEPNYKENNSKHRNALSDDSNTPKFIHDIIKSTLNNVVSNILNHNTSNLISKNIFLILNSGDISNFHVNSPVPKIINDRNNEKIIGDRKEKHTNNATVIPGLLKSPDTKQYPQLDIKFRRSRKYDNNSEKPILDKSFNDTRINSSIIPNTNKAQNDTAVDNNNFKDTDISSAEAPAFRSLIPNREKKLNIISTTQAPISISPNIRQINPTKSLPSTQALPFDLNSLPLNNIIGDAVNLIIRLKRNAIMDDNCRKVSEKYIDVKTGNPCQSNTDLDPKKEKPTRRSFIDYFSNIFKSSEEKDASVEVVCPLSVFVKLFYNQVFDKLSNNDSYIVSKIYPVFKSLAEDNPEVVNLASHEMSGIQFPVKLRLQLLHGDTKDFMKELKKYINDTLCSLS